ncbi:MAG: redox-regulated ATPase YchF [Bacteroidales bacterium]|nr:redox-regulated ATPase YchF [Bacteroidales bacterium]
MSLKCGIVGLTNSGKTTIFNCMSASKAEASRTAFTSSKSNIGIIPVPDERLYRLDALVKSQKVIPATIEIVDIPGLAKGSSHGEGIGNKFLADIQKTDALIHVLRCFDDETLPHIEGSVDPVRDIEILELELQVKDLEMIERKIQKYEKLTKVGEKDAKRGLEVLQHIKENLDNFNSIRNLKLAEEERKHLTDLFLLTDIPVLYVCNVDDTSAVSGNAYVARVIEAVKHENTEVIIIAGKLEAEIAELDNSEDRAAFLADAGLKEPGVNKLIRFAYRLLNLESFFTAGPKEVRAWTIHKGMTAPQASGVIHSDLERGFIRAEVMKYDDFIHYGSEHACKEAGKFYVEGKNYVVQEGDILHIRFNV